MKEIYACMTPENAGKIRRGLKWQTRRILKVQPPEEYQDVNVRPSSCGGTEVSFDLTLRFHSGRFRGTPAGRAALQVVRFAADSMLCVREAAWMWCSREMKGVTKSGRTAYYFRPLTEVYEKLNGGADAGERWGIRYVADHPARPEPLNTEGEWRYKAARFLPKWAVRTKRLITRVSVERVQDILRDGMRAEGVAAASWSMASQASLHHLRAGFTGLWDRVNGAGAWSRNDWVVVVEFRQAVDDRQVGAVA